MYNLLVGHGTCFMIEIECESNVLKIEDSATLWFSNYEQKYI